VIGLGVVTILGLLLGRAVAGWLATEVVQVVPPRPVAPAAVRSSSSAAVVARARPPVSGDASRAGASPETPARAVEPEAPVQRFRVQVGAFLDPRNADRLVVRLRAEGFGAATSVTEHSREVDSATYRVVRVGSHTTVEDAERTRGELAARGFDGFVVREP
jgi:cell division septation protein DedD